MRPVVFPALARDEAEDAVRYYEDRAEGLGLTFLAELAEAIDRIAANPEAYPPVGATIRRKLLRRFPFSVLYAIEPDKIRVLAIAHHKRRPGYWHDRV
ncbi:MAG: type II toxin-antitoxin system RelE/ParE family toxin [Limnochordaceae bacterium]|nr:type II toxin-antitoxin system RelE/ParE family toxin [Limnochordaceae bacterium]